MTTAATLSARGLARSHGFKAAREGKPLTDNPYVTKEYRELWAKGYREFEARIREVRK